MKGIISILLVFAAIFFSGCSKNNILPVSGTINGVSAITLYGNSGKLTDYVLLSTDASDEEIAYDGQTYSYYTTSSGGGIIIMVSSTVVVKGTLSTTGSETTLTVDNIAASGVFNSSVYTSR